MPRKTENETPGNPPQLEASLAEISAIIEKMEQDKLTLEQSLECFEQGIKLVRLCQKMLSDAEQKVQILMQNHQQETLVTYDLDNKGPNNNQKNEGTSSNEIARE